MKAINVMTFKVATIAADAQIETAHTLMLRLGVRHLPVISNGKLVGILSDRDVLLCAGKTEDGFVYPPSLVAQSMSVDCVTAQLHTPIADLAKLMLAHKIDAVPIVLGDKELLGLVTSTDLLRVVGVLPGCLSMRCHLLETGQSGGPECTVTP